MTQENNHYNSEIDQSKQADASYASYANVIDESHAEMDYSGLQTELRSAYANVTDDSQGSDIIYKL